MAGFDLALSQVRDGSHDLLPLDQINQLARDAGHHFRNTALSPRNTLELFVQQVASGNIACSAVQFLAGEEFTDAAWCQARKRLPLAVIEQANRRLVDRTISELQLGDDVGDGPYRWKGHRLRVVDGSTDSMPDTPALREHYGVPAPARSGLGFPMSHLMLLMDHKSGLLGKEDQLVEYFKPVNRPQWMNKTQWDAVPESIVVREVRRTVKRNGFRPMTVTITTTLTDSEKYPADELIELRLTRWMIETNIRHLKTTLGMDVLKCKTVEGVRKERQVFILVYNLIRSIMLKAARSQKVNVNRLNFANTLAWLRHGDTTILAKIKMNPLRPGRLEPRVIKRQKKQFPYMTAPRSQLKAQLRALHCDTA